MMTVCDYSRVYEWHHLNEKEISPSTCHRVMCARYKLDSIDFVTTQMQCVKNDGDLRIDHGDDVHKSIATANDQHWH